MPQNQEKGPSSSEITANEQISARRAWLLGLFNHVEVLQPSHFSDETRAAFEYAVDQGAFDDESSSRSTALEQELLGAMAETAGKKILEKKRGKKG